MNRRPSNKKTKSKTPDGKPKKVSKKKNPITSEIEMMLTNKVKVLVPLDTENISDILELKTITLPNMTKRHIVALKNSDATMSLMKGNAKEWLMKNPPIKKNVGMNKFVSLKDYELLSGKISKTSPSKGSLIVDI